MAKALKSNASAAHGTARERGKLYEQLSPGELDVYVSSFAGKLKSMPLKSMADEESDAAAMIPAKKADRKRAHR